MASEKTNVKWFDKLSQHDKTLLLNYISKFNDIIDGYAMKKIGYMKGPM